MMLRLPLCKAFQSGALQPVKLYARHKDGSAHIQTYHVGKHAPQKEKKEPRPGDDLTLMSMMQRFSTEEAARVYFERLRWPDGPVCPYCGSTRAYKLTEPGRPTRYKCASCRKKYSVTVGTVMESTNIPLNKWLLAFYMMCASKTQISALQMQRQLEIKSYKSALFMAHRIRFALMELYPNRKFAGVVEVDETWIGGKARGKGRAYTGNKTAVVTAVERGGQVRSRVTGTVDGQIIGKFLDQHVDPAANLNTDESRVYLKHGKRYASHDTVNHGKNEYVRLDRSTGRLATTNTAEGYFGNTKNSVRGTHHSISPQHTALYMAETDYKYNTRDMTDGARTVAAIPLVEGKRMTQRQMFDRRKPSRRAVVVKAVRPSKAKDEMRMKAADFDEIMRKVLNMPMETPDDKEQKQK